MSELQVEVELADIYDFLAALPPFDKLPAPLLRQAVGSIQIEYVRQGTVILAIGHENSSLYVVRKGAVELHSAEGTLVTRLEEGELFGYPSLLTGDGANSQVTAIEDSLLYLLPAAVFHTLRSQSKAFDRYLNQALTHRIRSVVQERPTNFALTAQLRDMAIRPPITAAPETTILEGVQRMSAGQDSALVILEKDKVCGIFTDRDIRNRVVARNVPLDTPLSEVMTRQPITTTADTYLFQALLTMSRHNIHHIPVLEDDGRFLGIVTISDISRLQAANPVYLIGDVLKAADVAKLTLISQRLPQLVRQLIEADAKAYDIGHIVTLVADALTQRLLQLGEAKFGPPPVPYAWLAFGSQARYEQTAHSDQDNALLLADGAADAAATAEHDAYFAQLAAFVSDGLNSCGYVYCPGNVMATNGRWRQPLATWRAYFADWIQRPEPQALLHASIFFDIRHIYGDASLTKALKADIAAQVPENKRFLANLVTNAVAFQPPLGFFRRFVLEKDGEHKDRFDLKHKGVVPIVELARVYALEVGATAVNTHDRLEQVAPTAALAPNDALDLQDALEFIAYVRLQHQGRQLAAGTMPDNYVSPEELSRFERQHLKTAFTIVSKMQDALARRYLPGFMGG